MIYIQNQYNNIPSINSEVFQIMPSAMSYVRFFLGLLLAIEILRIAIFHDEVSMWAVGIAALYLILFVVHFIMPRG